RECGGGAGGPGARRRSGGGGGDSLLLSEPAPARAHRTLRRGWLGRRGTECGPGQPEDPGGRPDGLHALHPSRPQPSPGNLLPAALLAPAGWFYTPIPGQPLAGVTLGLISALGLITLEVKLRNVPAHRLVGSLVGGVTGLFGARLVWGAMEGLDLVAEHFIHA